LVNRTVTRSLPLRHQSISVPQERVRATAAGKLARSFKKTIATRA
jgi:hypothetical protein